MLFGSRKIIIQKRRERRWKNMGKEKWGEDEGGEEEGRGQGKSRGEEMR